MAGAKAALGNFTRRRVLALTVALEVVVRFAVATWWDALSVVIFPPIIAVVLLGAVFSEPATTSSTVESRPLADRLRAVGPRLAGVAVTGHALALAIGTGLFLVVDTIIRYAFYASEGTLGWRIQVVIPLVGVAYGAFIAWGPLVDTVGRVAGDESIRVAGTATLGRALRDWRWLGKRLALHAAGGGFVVGALVVGFVISGIALLVIPLLAVFIAVAALDTVYARRPASSDTADVSVPGGRLIAVLLVFVVLVSAVSAVRATETRPITTERTPLPEDPNAMYETALSNAAAGDHAITVTEEYTPHGRWTIAVDREEREARITSQNLEGLLNLYQSPGTSFRGSIPQPMWFVLGYTQLQKGIRAAVPGYWMFLNEYEITGHFGAMPDYGLPYTSTGQWHVRERSNETVVLELTNGSAVYRSLGEDATQNATYETAWVRMRVDTSRGVVTGGELRLNAAVRGERVRVHRTYDVRTGSRVDVRRPDELDGRTLGEWTWKLFAY